MLPRDSAVRRLEASRWSFPFIQRVFADTAERIPKATQIETEIVRKFPDQAGVADLPCRCVAERFFFAVATETCNSPWISRESSLPRPPYAIVIFRRSALKAIFTALRSIKALCRRPRTVDNFQLPSTGVQVKHVTRIDNY